LRAPMRASCAVRDNRSVLSTGGSVAAGGAVAAGVPARRRARASASPAAPAATASGTPRPSARALLDRVTAPSGLGDRDRLDPHLVAGAVLRSGRHPLDLVE